MKNSNKKVETTETVQQLKARLIKELDGKLKGFNLEMLSELDAQQLQTIKDSVKEIKSVKESAVRSNLSTEMIEIFNDLKVTEMKSDTFLAHLRMLNIENFINVSDKVKIDIDTEIETITTWAVLGYVTSTSDKDSNSERVNKWLKRAPAYAKSHLIGDGKDSLFRNEDSKVYFELKNGNYILVTKETKK